MKEMISKLETNSRLHAKEIIKNSQKIAMDFIDGNVTVEDCQQRMAINDMKMNELYQFHQSLNPIKITDSILKEVNAINYSREKRLN